MILRWSSAWTAPGGLPNMGNYTWAVPPTLGSCFMMRLVVTDKAGQRGWDWSGPVPTSPTTDPDPLTGRFQISAYDLTAPNVTWQAPAAHACIGPSQNGNEQPGHVALLGPFTVNANDPESGIDWVFFQAKWPSGTATNVSPAFPAPTYPWFGLPCFLYTQPEPPGTYTGSGPDSDELAARRHPFDVVGDGPQHGRQHQDRDGRRAWCGRIRMRLEPSCLTRPTDALDPTALQSTLGNYSFIGGDRQIKGTVAENWVGEVAAVHFSWQRDGLADGDASSAAHAHRRRRADTTRPYWPVTASGRWTGTRPSSPMAPATSSPRSRTALARPSPATS